MPACVFLSVCVSVCVHVCMSALVSRCVYVSQVAVLLWVLNVITSCQVSSPKDDIDMVATVSLTCVCECVCVCVCVCVNVCV